MDRLFYRKKIIILPYLNNACCGLLPQGHAPSVASYLLAPAPVGDRALIILECGESQTQNKSCPEVQYPHQINIPLAVDEASGRPGRPGRDRDVEFDSPERCTAHS